MSKINIHIDDIYNNLLLISILHKYNFANLIKEAEAETNEKLEMFDDDFIPKGYEGLYFTEVLARKMGSSLGEVCNLSDDRKKEIIQKLLQLFDPISKAYEISYSETENGSVEFQGQIRVFGASSEKEISLYYSDLLEKGVESTHSIYAYYYLTFCKENNEDDKIKAHYSISLSGVENFDSDYVYDCFEVWSGETGFFAEFIEKAIEDYHISINQHEDDNEKSLEAHMDDQNADNVLSGDSLKSNVLTNNVDKDNTIKKQELDSMIDLLFDMNDPELRRKIRRQLLQDNKNRELIFDMFHQRVITAQASDFMLVVYANQSLYRPNHIYELLSDCKKITGRINKNILKSLTQKKGLSNREQAQVVEYIIDNEEYRPCLISVLSDFSLLCLKFNLLHQSHDGKILPKNIFGNNCNAANELIIVKEKILDYLDSNNNFKMIFKYYPKTVNLFKNTVFESERISLIDKWTECQKNFEDETTFVCQKCGKSFILSTQEQTELIKKGCLITFCKDCAIREQNLARIRNTPTKVIKSLMFNSMPKSSKKKYYHDTDGMSLLPNE